MENNTSYWLIIEPYVYINIVSNKMLLLNTLDGKYVVSDDEDIISIIKNIFNQQNQGVLLIKEDIYNKENISNFIDLIREKYIGDVIPSYLTKEKPIQILPFFNDDIYKKNIISEIKNPLRVLKEVSIHLGNNTEINNVIDFIQPILKETRINILGDWSEFEYENKLFRILNVVIENVCIFCSYTYIPIDKSRVENFLYRIFVSFPVDENKWNSSKVVLDRLSINTEYVLEISSLEELLLAEEFIEQNDIKNYTIVPVYKSNNISFFEKYIFLDEIDILSNVHKIKNIFRNKIINNNYFGKIHIMENGDVYASLKSKKIGNIYNGNIFEIIKKELSNGNSWFRIRNQAPCCNCLYQWLCPPPSDFETIFGKSNLCHVNI